MAYNENPSYLASGSETITQYDVLVGAAGGAIGSVGPGTAGQLLQSGGNAANPAYSTTTYPATNAINTLLYASSANVMAALATANNGVLITSGAGAPSISSTLPSAVQGNITSTGNLGNQTNTTRSAFSAYASANKSNVTGDGTQYTVLFDTKVFDQATNYTASSGTFTAPVTGKYQFNWEIYLSGMTGSDTTITVFLNATGQVVYSMYDNAANVISGGIDIHSGSAFIAMTANDTAIITVSVTGSTKTVSVVGGALGSGPSYFSGYLVC